MSGQRRPGILQIIEVLRTLEEPAANSIQGTRFRQEVEEHGCQVRDIFVRRGGG